MNLYDILNTVILALSIATILITLVAFILYQLRRLNKQNNSNRSEYKLETLFFRRFAPHIEEKIQEEEREKRRQERLQKIKVPAKYLKLGTFFAILTTILVASLFFGKSGKEVLNQQRLEKRAETVRLLKTKGMIKNYSLSPISKTTTFDIQPIFDIESKNLENIAHLKKQVVVLLEDKTLLKDKDSYHFNAINDWSTYFENNKITFLKTTNIKKYKTDLVIIPHFSYLSKNLIREIARLEKLGVSFVFTGPIGTSKKQPYKDFVKNWLQSHLNIEFHKNKNPKQFHASQFVGSNFSPWDFQPGQVQTYTVSNNQFVAIPNDPKHVLSYETTYRGKAIYHEDQWIAKSTVAFADNSIRLWSAWEPEENNIEKDYLISQMLSYATKKPKVIKNWWPNNTASTTVLSVDSEDQFQNLEYFLEIFEKKNVPITLFLVAELYENFSKMVNKFDLPIEYASHGDNHDSFLKQAEIKQFDRIQTSRHIIEENSSSPVTGFRPPYEEMNNFTINSVGANYLSYIFGDQRCLALSPCLLSNNVIFFPRILHDDFNLIRDRTLISPENIYKAMLKDLKQAQLTNGGYFLSLHTQAFGKEPYLGVVSKLIDQIKIDNTIKLTTFNELADWWKIRSLLKTQIITKQKKSFLQITNKNSFKVDSFVINLSSVELTKNFKRLPTNENQIYCRKINNFIRQCTITNLNPHGIIEVPFE